MLESTTERNLPRVDPESEELGPLPEPQTFYYNPSSILGFPWQLHLISTHLGRSSHALANDSGSETEELELGVSALHGHIPKGYTAHTSEA